MAAAIALALFIALISGCVGQFLHFVFQQLIEHLFDTSSHQFFKLPPLIPSSFSCTIFSDMVCYLLPNVCVATSFYQRSANHVFLCSLLFAKLIVPYRGTKEKTSHPAGLFAYPYLSASSTSGGSHDIRRALSALSHDLPSVRDFGATFFHLCRLSRL